MDNPEQYWDNKHPTGEIVYDGRYVPGHTQIITTDVRHFIWNNDVELNRILNQEICKNHTELEAMSHDELALRIQKWVTHGKRTLGSRRGERALRYVADETARGYNEFWQYPNETLAQGIGDCEDGGILIASLLLCGGVPKWRVRATAGYVRPSPTAPQGGHLWCSYNRELDNEFVALDWCYLEDSNVPVAEKILLKNRPEYGDVWFSFNDIYAWTHTHFSTAGRVRREPK